MWIKIAVEILKNKSVKNIVKMVEKNYGKNWEIISQYIVNKNCFKKLRNKF